MADKNPLLVKKHWHLVVYEVPAVGLPTKISMYMATKKRLPSVPEIQMASAERNIPQGSVLLAVNYLGYGSQCDFTGEPPVTAPSKVSDAFMSGMEVALKTTVPADAVNPYDNSEHDVYLAQEWQLGFANGLRLRSAVPHALDHQQTTQ